MNIRYLVDWDNDSFFCRAAQSGDPLNVTFVGFSHVVRAANDYYGDGDVLLSPVLIDDSFGVMSLRVDMDTNAPILTAGVGWGVADGGVEIPEQAWEIEPSTEYTVTFWIKIDQADVPGLGTTSLQAHIYTGTSTVAVLKGTQNFAYNDAIVGDGDFHAYSMTFTSEGTHEYAYFDILAPATGAYGQIFEVAGFMITEGDTTPAGYNVGDQTNAYDNITENVLSARTSSGRTSPRDLMFSEGVCDITLKNPDSIYLPNNVSSPLYGAMAPNLRVLIEVQNPVTEDWTTIWSGWVSKYTPNHKPGGIKTVQLRAVQGRENLEQMTLKTSLASEISISDAMIAVLKSGFIAPTAVFHTIVGYSRVGVNTFVGQLNEIGDYPNSASIIADENTPPLGFMGEDWVKGTTTLSQALRDIQEVARGFVWLDRRGRFIYRSRYYFNYADADEDLNIQTDVQGVKYNYGEDIENFVRVHYHPKTTVTNALLWETGDEPIEVPGLSIIEIKAELRELEGAKIVATALNGVDHDTAPTTLTIVSSTGADMSRFVNADLILRNGEALLRFRNVNKRRALVNVSLVGTVVYSYSSASVERTNNESIIRNKQQAAPEIKSKSLIDPLQAGALGDYVVYLNSQERSQYVGITLMNKTHDPTALARMLSIEIGTVLGITDTETGEDDLRVLVVGEEFDTMPGHIQVTYTTLPLDNFWEVGTSALAEDTVLGY